MWSNPQETVDLATLTGEILNEKLHFFAVSTVSMSEIHYT